ncbi:MAG: hypothetical protein ACI9VR_004249 [Cognaticolwellia sp.]|jgi:hypothetical protein
MSLILMLACSGEVLSVDPDEGSARGGQEVRVTGKRLDASTSLYFGEVQAQLKADGRDVLAIVPPGFDGLVDVTPTGGMGLEDGYRYQALELSFVQVAPHYLPAPAAILTGVVAELNDDSAQDVAMLLADGRVQLWMASGTGALSAEDPTVGTSTAIHATDLNGDGIDEVIVGANTGESPRVVNGLALPWAGGSVSAIGSADLDQDGLPELLFIEPGVGLRVLWNASQDDEIRMRVVRPEAEVLPGTCPTVSPAAESTASCTIIEKDSGFAGQVSILGSGATVSVALPVVGRIPAQIQWTQQRLDGGAQITASLVDAAGVRVSGAPVPIDSQDWDSVALNASGWEGWDTLVEPLTLELSISVVDSAEIGLDTLQVDYADGGASGLSRFEQWPALYAITASAGQPQPADMDGDGDLDLAIATLGGLLVLETVGETEWQALDPGRVPESCIPADLSWVGTDLALSCAGQDSFLRNDGAGYFFDDTAASMPVDNATGAAISATDLDRNGDLDLLVATNSVDRLYLGTGTGFVDESPLLGLESGATRDLLALDVDGDGDLDVLALGAAGAQLFVSVDQE